MKLLIKITKNILEQSKMCNVVKCLSGTESGVGANCAIALAVRSIFPDAWVDEENIIPFFFKELHKPIVHKIKLPYEACGFIAKFDSSTPDKRIQMPEFSFEIDVPDEIINQIGISEVHKILQESKTMELVT